MTRRQRWSVASSSVAPTLDSSVGGEGNRAKAVTAAVAISSLKKSLEHKRRTKGSEPAPLVKLIMDTGTLGHLLLFLGGMYDFPSQRIDRMYALVWSISFSICFITCSLNVFMQQEPFHNVPSDFMTAYIHVPVFYAWRFWRCSLEDAHFLRIVDPIQSLHPHLAILLRRFLRWYVKIVFILMLIFSALVLCAYAVPALPRCREQPDEQRNAFACFHALSMMFVIPPVICVTLMVYSFVALVFAVHIVDFQKLCRFIEAHIKAFQARVLTAAHDEGDLEVRSKYEV
jgi:hypothetical protein